jgi:GNAT superfamily N-acetyltransferase
MLQRDGTQIDYDHAVKHKRAKRGDHRRLNLSFGIAKTSDAPAIAALHIAVADQLTGIHGHGPWSGHPNARGVLLGITPPVAGVRRKVTSLVLIAFKPRSRGRIIGTLRLATKKPWAIDVKYFTPVERALYLTGMAVEPRMQRQGVGRQMLEEALNMAEAWPSQSIRLDAHDTSADGAGAGGFYARCGFREVGRAIYRGTPLVYFEMLL